MSKTYDVKCDELARQFLPEDATEEDVAGLASTIQESIEDWLKFETRQRDRDLLDRERAET